jgi:hypothetical protein
MVLAPGWPSPRGTAIRGQPRGGVVAGGWFVPSVGRLPAARTIRGLPRDMEVSGGGSCPRIMAVFPRHEPSAGYLAVEW